MVRDHNTQTISFDAETVDLNIETQAENPHIGEQTHSLAAVHKKTYGLCSMVWVFGWIISHFILWFMCCFHFLTLTFSYSFPCSPVFHLLVSPQNIQTSFSLTCCQLVCFHHASSVRTECLIQTCHGRKSTGETYNLNDIWGEPACKYQCPCNWSRMRP